MAVTRVLAKRGTAAQIAAVSSANQLSGEITFATDTKDFYVSDGTQFNKIGKDQLSQFGEISVVNNVGSWHLSTTNILDINPPESNPTGITFKPDGTRIFTLGYTRNRVQQYDLSTAWDLTSAGSATESEYLVQNNLSSTQEDFFIDSSGTRMYVLSRGSDSIGQFTLNTAWEISDITFVQDVHLNSTGLSGGVAGFVTGETEPAGLTFKPDGTILYIVGYSQDKVHQIPLSTAWDISTHGTITELSISPANTSQAIQFSSDGKEMYILDYSLDGIAHFTLSTAWDVTTANLTAQSVPFTRMYEATPTGLYYRDDLSKCFIVGRSGDFAREVMANNIYSFNEGITAPVVYSPQINADALTTGGGGGGYNNFYNATYARTTFQTSATTYLGYETNAPLIRFGNNVYNNARIQVSRFTYFGSETVDDPTRVPRFQFFPSLLGAKSKVYFGQFLEDTTYLIGGSMDIESIADTFDHKGEITLGGELKVSGTKPLIYKDPNLYTQGTQIVLDNFNETTETTLDNHTPDTGSGYTNVYISSSITFPTHLPIIETNAGYLRPAFNNSNDGYRFVNDTTISTNNYEARAVIKRQHGGDDPFVLFVKYIDEDNYFAMAFGNSYVYCTPISVVNGVYSVHGYLYYYANTSTADNENIEVALRVVGNNVHVFYEGVYRGSREINITGAGKAGIGFGKINDSQYTGYDIGINNHISKFEVYELPDSLFDGSDSVHYIENGSLGIGTTSPSRTLHVISKSSGDGIRISTSQDISVATLYNTNSESFPVGALSLQYGSTNAGLISGQSNRLNIRGGGSSGGSISFASHTTEMMRLTSTGLGIGTTSPTEKLEVSGNISGSGNLTLNGNIYKAIENSYLGLYGGSDNTNIDGFIKIHGDSNYWGRVQTNIGYSSANSKAYWTLANSTELMTLTGAGRLGINTTSPDQLLHVAGNGKMTNIYLLGNIIHEGDVDTQIKFATDTITFDTAGSERLTINSTGNVGIGTTSPSEKLEVSGNIKTTGNVTFDGGAGTLDGLRTINRTGEIRINTTQGTRFGETTLSVGGIVDIVGKYDKIPLGIKQEAGTTQNKLATFKDSSGNEVLAITTNGGFETLDSNLVKRFEFGHAYSPSPVDGMGIGLDLKTENASGVVVSVGNIDVIQDDVSADLSSMRLNVGETTPTEIMRLESSGKVGIGTNNPLAGLEVANAENSTLRLTRNSNNGNYLQLQGGSSGAIYNINTSGTQEHIFQNGGYEKMRLTSTGNLGIGTTSPVGILHAYSTSAPVIESPSNASIIIRRNDNVGYSSLLKYHSGNSEKFVAGLSDSGDFTNSTGEEYFIGTTKTNPLVVLKNDGKLGIGTTSPDASAILDIASTTKGVLFPRMTSSQRTAISSPATGLIVYQTDATEGLYIYKSTGWTQII